MTASGVSEALGSARGRWLQLWRGFPRLPSKWLIGILAVLALAPSAYLALLSADMPHLGSFSDDGLYWVSAKSLAEGTGYRLVSLPGQPMQTKYPPLFPAYLSLVWSLSPEFPRNLGLATLFAWIWVPLFTVLCYPAFRDLGMSRSGSLILCALVALNFMVLYFGIKLMSELMFGCLLLGVLIVVERVDRGAVAQWVALLAGTLAGAAFLCRTVAVVLLLSVPVLLGLRRRRLAAVLFVLGMAPAVLWWSFWVHLHQAGQGDPAEPYYTSYIQFYFQNIDSGNFARVIWKNLQAMLAGFRGLLAPDGEPLTNAVLRLAAFLSLGGVIRHARLVGTKYYHPFAGAYVLELLPWPSPPNSRMLLPLLPLMLVGVVTEISHIRVLVERARGSRALSERLTARAVQLAGVLLIGLCFYQNARVTAVWVPDSIASQRAALDDRRCVYEWIRENVPRSAGILAYSDVAVFLYTGHHAESIVLPSRALYADDRKGLIEPFYSLPATARARHLGYVVVGPDDFDQMLSDYERSRYSQILSRLSDLELMYSYRENRVYRVRGSGNGGV